MRLRSSIRRASKTFKCLQESNDVKSKPCVTSGNVPRKIKRNICEPNPLIPKNPPSVRKNVSASRRVNKEKQTSTIPEDPYLFIDNDSDDYKENVIPNSSKDVTKKCAKKTHPDVKVKVANPKKSKSKQWTASTAFTKQYIPSGKPNDARYEDALHANAPESIVTAVPLVSKTVNPKSASAFPESNQLISPGGLTISCSVAKMASTYAESKTVSFNFPEKKAYDSWLAEFNNELQKYESFELSIENQALPTDDH
ncbi:hypothetical protein Smp_121460 [Schistosoma mansoni]|uniref:hypothetical protein n=1 Tax=Schistosoma mansoni TaxID=6183 RepID=UPI0001A6248F|nr:hypothetical protein Smp_121460 [Schistosoma mansoni]|eukprot:XP_018644945.1 hypothetical protein Smp_121460 [Schistosoma mansoni]